MKGGVDRIALVLGQTSGSGAYLSTRRGSDHLVRPIVNSKHANFADGSDAGTCEDDRDDPHVSAVEKHAVRRAGTECRCVVKQTIGIRSALDC
jgi:hypothetical protein